MVWYVTGNLPATSSCSAAMLYTSVCTLFLWGRRARRTLSRRGVGVGQPCLCSAISLYSSRFPLASDVFWFKMGRIIRTGMLPRQVTFSHPPTCQQHTSYFECCAGPHLWLCIRRQSLGTVHWKITPGSQRRMCEEEEEANATLWPTLFIGGAPPQGRGTCFQEESEF